MKRINLAVVAIAGLLIILILGACQAASSLPSLEEQNKAEVASSVLEFPYGNANEAGEEQASGRYKSPAWFSLSFTFETTKAFRGIGEQLPIGELFGLAQGSAYLPPRQLLFWVVDPSVSVETTIAQLRATPKVELSPDQAVTVAGISGIQFDAAAQANPAQAAGENLAAGAIAIPAIGPLVGHQGSDWHTNTAEARLRFIVLTVMDRTLLIYIEAPADEFQDFVTEVDQVLSTVKFDGEASSASSTP